MAKTRELPLPERPPTIGELENIVRRWWILKGDIGLKNVADFLRALNVAPVELREQIYAAVQADREWSSGEHS
jgi:hypothetical protein